MAIISSGPESGTFKQNQITGQGLSLERMKNAGRIMMSG
jgi:hypothetical protein